MSDYEAAKRDEMFTGYLDGYNDARIDFPERSDRSEAYKHGWLNGRDDRIGVPRDAASALRAKAAELLQSDMEQPIW